MVQAQEILVQEKISLLTQLSSFLPPPLCEILEHTPRDRLDRGLSNHLKFWSTVAGRQLEKEGNWWSVDELGEGASIVRSRGSGGEREVWVLKTGEGQGTLHICDCDCR